MWIALSGAGKRRCPLPFCPALPCPLSRHAGIGVAMLRVRGGRSSPANRRRGQSLVGRQGAAASYARRAAVWCGRNDSAGPRGQALAAMFGDDEGTHQLISSEVNISGREEYSQDSADKCSAVDGKGTPRNTSRGLESAHDVSASAGAGEANLKNASTPTARGRPKRETVSSQSASGNGSVRAKRKIYDSEVCRHQGKALPCRCLPVLGLSHPSHGSTPSSTMNVVRPRTQAARHWHHTGTWQRHERGTARGIS